MEKFIIYLIKFNLEKYTGKDDNEFYPIYIDYVRNKIEILDEFNNEHFEVSTLFTFSDDSDEVYDEEYVIFIKDSLYENYKKLFKMI